MKSQFYADFLNFVEPDGESLFKTRWVDDKLLSYRHYHDGIKHGYKRYQKTEKIKKEMNEQEKIEYQEKKLGYSVRRSVKAIKDMVVANFGLNHYFITLTFNEEKSPWVRDVSGYQNIPNIWRLFAQRYFDDYLKDKKGLKYLCIPEYFGHQGNRWHLHILVNKKPFYGRDRKAYTDGCKLLADKWGYGTIVRIQKIDSFNIWKRSVEKPDKFRLAHYISKYVSKSIKLGAYPSGKKRYFASKNLEKVTELFSSLDPYELSSKPRQFRTTKEYNWQHTGKVTEHYLNDEPETVDIS
jgi:hypothetical protein